MIKYVLNLNELLNLGLKHNQRMGINKNLANRNWESFLIQRANALEEKKTRLNPLLFYFILLVRKHSFLHNFSFKPFRSRNCPTSFCSLGEICRRGPPCWSLGDVLSHLDSLKCHFKSLGSFQKKSKEVSY